MPLMRHPDTVSRQEIVGQVAAAVEQTSTSVNEVSATAAQLQTAAERVREVVRAAAVTFDSTAAFFGRKAFVSGNPVRLGELMLLMDEFPRMFEIVEHEVA